VTARADSWMVGQPPDGLRERLKRGEGGPPGGVALTSVPERLYGSRWEAPGGGNPAGAWWARPAPRAGPTTVGSAGRPTPTRRTRREAGLPSARAVRAAAVGNNRRATVGSPDGRAAVPEAAGAAMGRRSRTHGGDEMADATERAVTAYCDSAAQAEQAAQDLMRWDKANDEIKLGAIGILTKGSGSNNVAAQGERGRRV